jgi:hypothetical protein
MRKLLLIPVLALAAYVIARAARRHREIPGAAELAAALLWLAASPAITKNTPKTNATKVRVDNLVGDVGALRSQVGTVLDVAANISATETGLSSEAVSGASWTLMANGSDGSGGGSTQTGAASAGTAHTHFFGGHSHGMTHYHYTQLETSFNNVAGEVRAIRTALIAAGIL